MRPCEQKRGGKAAQRLGFATTSNAIAHGVPEERVESITCC